jgi:threonine dehydrogenase-like Zn-dependent dehydrogenase
MQGVVFLGGCKLELQEFSDPKPESSEVVLEIKASGMCGSDLKLYRSSGGAASLGLGGGDGPMIGGHEPCGVVVEVGSCVTKAQARPGMRVMVHHYKGCGVCKHCGTGWAQLCRHGITVYGVTGNGAHARYMKVPVSTLVPLPDELSFEVGAAVSCGTGTAYSALRRIGLSGRETIAIFGQGPVGLAATQLAKAMGARVIALDVGETRLAMAKELGADVTIDPNKEDPVQAINEQTHGEGAELTMDCSGNPDARLAAVRSTRTWGTVGLVGEGNELTVDVSQHLIRRQLTLMGSWTFSTVIQAECAQFIVDRRIPAEKVFTHRYKRLDQAEDAYELFDKQDSGKGVFLL